MNFLVELFSKSATKKILVLISISLFFYITKSLFNLFLLTFIFTYLIYSLQSFIVKHLKRITPVNELAVTTFIYLVFISLIFLVSFRYLPMMLGELKSIIFQVRKFFIENSNYNPILYISQLLDEIDIKSYLGKGTNYVLYFVINVWKWSFNILASIVLSMFFMLEKRKVKHFLERFKISKFSWTYNYLEYLGGNFVNSFGKVMQAQILIALTNSLLSVLILSFLGFSNLLGLGAMIFILSLIPVAGVIISLIPLSIIAFNIGGVIKVVYVIIMIVAIHGLESYFLNPKFMSAKTKLPIFFIFLILIISEHFIGMWGLLIGIPLFIFILDLIGVKSE